MEQRQFGGLARSFGAIGQGTWYIEQADRTAAIAAIRRGIALGMTHLDTAEIYGAGASEKVVGAAIEGHRDEVFLVSKVAPRNATTAGTIAACEASLARLGTDRLDCYLLHWRGDHPLAATIEGFERLKSQGKILSWGVSNFDVADLDEVLAIAGPGKLACNQVLYHLEERAIEHRVIPWCERHGVTVTGYSPFGHANFPAESSVGGTALAAIARAHGASARQVALAFLTRRPSLCSIPKAAGLAHLEENAGAGRLALSAAEIAAIERAFPLGRLPSVLPTL